MTYKNSASEAGQPPLELRRPATVIAPLSKLQWRPASELLGRAFADDPVMSFIFPDAETRPARVAALMRLAMRSYAPQGRIDAIGGANEVRADCRAVAVWQQPFARPSTGWPQFRNTLEAICKLRSALDRAAQLQAANAAHRIAQPHWYLAVLGTDPVWQGQSLGSRLLDGVLQRCDAEQLPVYLESSHCDNIPFYQRHGFEVLHEIRIPKGPSLWGMRRAPVTDR